MIIMCMELLGGYLLLYSYFLQVWDQVVNVLFTFFINLKIILEFKNSRIQEFIRIERIYQINFSFLDHIFKKQQCPKQASLNFKKFQQLVLNDIRGYILSLLRRREFNLVFKLQQELIWIRLSYILTNIDSRKHFDGTFGLLLTTIVIFKQNNCIIYSAAIILTFGVLVLLVGMGFGAQFYTDKYQEHYYYDTPIAFWFGQLAIYVIAMVEIYNFHSDHSVQQKVSQLHLPITQQSVHLYNPNGK
ncbi:hypothetical protein pb186bvf_016934 [Paramecium bursaria]